MATGSTVPLCYCVFVPPKGSVTTISDQKLHVVTNNDSNIRRNHSVVFTVMAPPKLGRLVQRMPDNSIRNIYTFTQSMVGEFIHIILYFAIVSTVDKLYFLSSPHLMSQVNHGVILYDQNKPESVGWSATDTFSFTVSCPPALLPPQTFTILISYQAHKHDNRQHETSLLNNAGTGHYKTHHYIMI